MPSSEVPFGSFADRPNQITAARLLVTVACFVALSFDAYAAGLFLFVLAAATDWADGFWARRWGPITKLGRILDPLADKLLVCGVFIYLSAISNSRIASWMAVVVLARELMVTTLRAIVESSGGDFSARWVGKVKMVAQCIAAGVCLLYVSAISGRSELEDSASLALIVDLCVWIAVLLTAYSAVSYTQAALTSLRQENDSGC